MKSCGKCCVTVTGSFTKCPLCQTTLAEKSSDNTHNTTDIFPFISIVKYEHGLFFRLIQLCSVVVVIAALTVNWMIPHTGFWSLFVVAGVACVWLSLSVAIRKRHNILKNMIYQVTIISILSVLWDIFTGWRGWSIDFVIPIAFVATMSATSIIARILKIPVETYVIYLFVLIWYGVVPVAFVLIGWSKIIYPSLICVAVSFLSLSTLIVFEGKNMLNELKRRLHL